MKIYREESLRNFDFWSGARDTANVLTYDQFDEIESTLEEMYPDGIDETDLNDIFQHDPDTVAEWLGFEDWEQLERFNNGEEDEDEEEEDEDEEEEEEDEEE